MENGINRVSPAEVNLVVYEADNMSDTLVNIWIIKKTFRLINVNACFKEVRENWKQVQHGSFGKLLFLVSSETFLSTIKRNIAPLMEQNKNNGNRNVLVVTEYNDVDDDEDDDDFELLDEEEHNVIKVNKLNDVEEWWPSVLQFFKPKDLSSGNVVRKREYDCFFLFNEDSRTEAEWFKKHKDRLESFGIRCLKRDRNSQITDDIYMKNSRCIVMYVNNRRQTDRIKENIRKATENGCSVRLFLQDAEIEFAKRVQADCQVNLSGTSLLAHWANLLKDLDISKLYNTGTVVSRAWREYVQRQLQAINT